MDNFIFKYCIIKMNKECNPLKKKPNTICNPKTGRWVSITSKTGKELLKKQEPTPVLSVKQCDPAKKKPNTICNPKTGRWVLRSSKIGKELEKKQASIKNKVINSVEQEIKSTKKNKNIQMYEYGHDNKFRDTFINLFNKNSKKTVDIYDISKLGTSDSRTQSEMYKVQFKSSNPDRIFKAYGKRNTHVLDAFLKIKKVNKPTDIKKRTELTKKNPVYKEIELFKVTNKMQDDNVIDSVAYCYNDSILHKDYGVLKRHPYVMLITQDLKHFVPFSKATKYFQTVPKDVIFQMLYTLYCFKLVGIKHMDLHLNNFYIAKYDRIINKKYEILINGQFETFYVPTIYHLKIIDFDGGSKTAGVPMLKDKYTKIIHNPKIFTGHAQGKYQPDIKSNFLKIMKSFSRFNLYETTNKTNINRLEYKYKQLQIKNSNNNVPFITHNNDKKLYQRQNGKMYTSGPKKTFVFGQDRSYKKAKQLGTISRSMFNTYGMLMSVTPDAWMKIPDQIIYDLETVFENMYSNSLFQRPFSTQQTDHEMSQRHLFK